MVALNATPVGSAPETASAGVGEPVAVTVKLPAVPTLKVAAFALVIAGACCAAMVTVASEVPLRLVMR